MEMESEAYVVYTLLRTAEAAQATEKESAELVTRQLNRMERVAQSFDGTLALRQQEGLLVAFQSASEALGASCEMQRRCASLPQQSSRRTSLQIGIHKVAAESDAETDIFPNSRQRTSFDTAEQLARAAPANTIAFSNLVFAALDQPTRQASQVTNEVSGLEAYTIDWHISLPESKLGSAYQERKIPAAYKLVLRRGAKRRELNQLNSIYLFGRDPASDIVLTGRFASRVHAKLEICLDGCLLTDCSSNGTLVVFQSGMEVLLKQESYLLSGRGQLSFGGSASNAGEDVVEFWVSANSVHSSFGDEVNARALQSLNRRAG